MPQHTEISNGYRTRTWNASPDECLAVFYASAFSSLRGDIVEIGSWLGRSTLHLAKGCMLSGNGIVNAVDTFIGNAGYLKLYQKPLKANETIFEAFQRNIRTADLEDFVQAHPMKAETARKNFTQPVRMIFIDGCHEYDAVKRDIATWKDLLLPNGLLLLHDFRAEAPGSIKAIRESVLDSNEFKLVALVDSLLIAQKI